MASMFREIIEFFDRLGIYDVVLPFLLVFSVTFAVLEKTKIFGTITIKGETFTRKNYNAMVAFTMGFFVIASTQAVEIINEGLAKVAIIIVSFISFMLAIGVFYGEGENIFGQKGIEPFRLPLVIASLIGVIMIMMSVIETEDGNSWLEVAYGFISGNWNSAAVGSIILLVLLVGFMIWVTKDPGPKKPVKEGDER
ncbi:MAG: hypothetical protein ACOC32_02405 [Nanoarchaeota archaeon]